MVYSTSSKYLALDSAEQVIRACLSSRLDCINSLLFGLPDTQIQKKLQRVQITAASILTRTKKREHNLLLYDHYTGSIFLRELIIRLLKCLHGHALTNLQELVQLYEPAHSLHSSSKSLLKVPKTWLKTYSDIAFAKAAPILWNSLPSSQWEGMWLSFFI